MLKLVLGIRALWESEYASTNAAFLTHWLLMIQRRLILFIQKLTG